MEKKRIGINEPFEIAFLIPKSKRTDTVLLLNKHNYYPVSSDISTVAPEMVQMIIPVKNIQDVIKLDKLI